MDSLSRIDYLFVFSLKNTLRFLQLFFSYLEIVIFSVLHFMCSSAHIFSELDFYIISNPCLRIHDPGEMLVITQ